MHMDVDKSEQEFLMRGLVNGQPVKAVKPVKPVKAVKAVP